MAAARRPKGQRVFVALAEVELGLRVRAADAILDGYYTDPALAVETPEDKTVLMLVARQPRLRPDGKPYGVWCTAETAARVRQGLAPRGVMLPR